MSIRRERKKGILYSTLIHLFMLLLLVAGLPEIFETKHEMEPEAITVEVLPITSMSNVKPSETPPTPKQAPEKKAEAKKPSPPVKTADAPPAPPPPPLEQKKEKKEEKKVEKKEEKKPEKKMKEDDLLAVLKAVKETAAKEGKKNEKAEETSPSKSKSQTYDPSMPMSLSEKDAIKNQIMKCWTVPAGAKDAQNLVIVLRVQYEKDGSLINVTLADESKSRYGSDTFYRAAADSAMRAVRMCNPLQNLPQEKYSTWHDMKMYFDPKEMLL